MNTGVSVFLWMDRFVCVCVNECDAHICVGIHISVWQWWEVGGTGPLSWDQSGNLRLLLAGASTPPARAQLASLLTSQKAGLLWILGGC